jgi:hypothetical protein
MLREASAVLSLAIGRLGSAAIAALIIGPFGLAGTVQGTEILQSGRFHGQGDEHLKPTGKGWGHDDEGSSAAQASRFNRFSNNGILYHGGPVMLGTVNVYYIWYGLWDFTQDNTNTLLNAFGTGIGGTPYFNINTTYYSSSTSNSVSGLVKLSSQASPYIDKNSQGTALSDANVQAVVAKALTTGGGPLTVDTNGVYFVLTSKEVKETSGFCTQYCAWHTHGTIAGNDIKFGFIGNPLQCPSSCSAQTTTPNGNLGADGMANLIAHELAESVTDPDLNAWYDTRGQENADKCAWTFGTTSTLSTGAKYNVTWGSMKWLLQRNWVNANGGYCALNR